MGEEKEKKEPKVKIYQPQPGLQEKIVASNIDVVFCGGSMSSGKALIINELVCTPFGFKRMGDIKVGDTITGSDGGHQKVIATYDRGVMDNIELEFSDGRKVQCSRDHLWKIRRGWFVPKRYKNSGNNPDKLWSIWTTQMIIDYIDEQKNRKNNHYLRTPRCGEVSFTRVGNSRKMLVHPYVLGVLLGDGCLSSTACKPTITNPDREIPDKIRQLGYTVTEHGINSERCPHYYLPDEELIQGLKDLGLWGHLSKTKYIPEPYLYATIPERIELLSGLLDTDGTVDNAGHIQYSSISEELANNVAFLVRSLGGKATITSKIPHYVKNGEKVDCSRVYLVYIILPNASRFFNVKRKKNRTKESSQPDIALEGQIVGYKLLGQEQMKCITVSNPDGLFLTRDFIVTHNSFGLILSMAEPIQDPNFRAVFLRRNLNETKVAGGLFEDTKKVFSSYIRSAKESENPRITFKSGAFIDYTHISDETPANLLERIRGWQYPCIIMDEGTSFAWTTFRLLFSRNRGTSKWTNKFRVSCNPKKSSWIRTFIKDYVGPDGFIRPDWDGKIRYFYIKGKRVEDVIWGDTKEEVYAQCRYEIDEALDKFRKKGLDVDYRSLIKSFTFYLGSTAENKAMVGNDASYLGSVAAMGEAEARANLLGNWNVDEEDDDEAPIKSSEAKAMFTADAQVNNDRWITVDLADTGTDNTLILAWNGFHVIDYKILMQSTPRINAEAIAAMADKHGIGDSHIIYDAVRAAYMIDYLPQAQGYVSYRAPMGKYGRMADNLKTECYLRLVNMIVNQRLSFDDSVSQCCYRHLNLQPITFQTEFEEECSVVRFIEVGSGKKRLMNKKEMNAKLGKHRSMDLLDSCAMRMYPVLGYEYGEELLKTAVEVKKENNRLGNTVNVYDPSVWA